MASAGTPQRDHQRPHDLVDGNLASDRGNDRSAPTSVRRLIWPRAGDVGGEDQFDNSDRRPLMKALTDAGKLLDSLG